METLYCQKCGEELKSDEPVFGSIGNFFCADCFKPEPNLFAGDKKNFRKNIDQWNQLSKESNSNLMAKVKGSNYYN